MPIDRLLTTIQLGATLAGQPDSATIEQKAEDTIQTPKQEVVEEKRIEVSGDLKIHKDLTQGNALVIEPWAKYKAGEHVDLANFTRLKNDGYFGKSFAFIATKDLLKKNKQQTLKVRSKNVFVHNNELYSTSVHGINAIYKNKKTNTTIIATYAPLVSKKGKGFSHNNVLDLAVKQDLGKGFYFWGYAIAASKNGQHKLVEADAEIGKDFGKFKTAVNVFCGATTYEKSGTYLRGTVSIPINKPIKNYNAAKRYHVKK